jgi:hypothetical protein
VSSVGEKLKCKGEEQVGWRWPSENDRRRSVRDTAPAAFDRQRAYHLLTRERPLRHCTRHRKGSLAGRAARLTSVLLQPTKSRVTKSPVTVSSRRQASSSPHSLRIDRRCGRGRGRECNCDRDRDRPWLLGFGLDLEMSKCPFPVPAAWTQTRCLVRLSQRNCNPLQSPPRVTSGVSGTRSDPGRAIAASRAEVGELWLTISYVQTQERSYVTDQCGCW